MPVDAHRAISSSSYVPRSIASRRRNVFMLHEFQGNTLIRGRKPRLYPSRSLVILLRCSSNQIQFASYTINIVFRER